MKASVGAVLITVALSSWGCAGGESAVRLAQQIDSLFTKDRIVASIPGEADGELYELIWGKTHWTWNGREIFVTVHATEVDTGAYIASIYRRVNATYGLLERLRSADSRFDEPVFFRPVLEGAKEKEDLIAISEVNYGTGQLRREHIFRFEPNGGMEPVEFVAAWEWFQQRLQPGEGIWKDGENEFGGAEMKFAFYIWREGDGNCCPTAGKVTGTYGLEREGGKYRIIVKSFERRPYRHPGAEVEEH